MKFVLSTNLFFSITWSLVCLLTTNVIFGQTGSITGKVIDNQTKNPIEYATIALYNSEDSMLISGTITREDGSFEIVTIPLGIYHLQVDFMGYETKRINGITITNNNKRDELQPIYLNQSSIALEEVQIVGEKSYVEYKIDKKVVNVSQQLNSAGGSATDAIKNIPSIETTIDGDIKLRGSVNFTLLIDGRPTLIDANDMMDQIPASTIDRIEIITNPSAKYDPDGTAGIINVITKKNSLEGFSGIVNLSGGSGYQVLGDANLGYRGEKFTISGGFELNDHNISTTEISDRETLLNDTTTYLTIDDQGTRYNRKKSIKGDISCFLTKRNTLSLSGNYSLLSIGHETTGKSHLWNNISDNYFLSKDNFDIDPHVLELNFSDEQVFDSIGNHKINFNLFMVNADVQTNENLYKYNTNSNYNEQQNLYDQTMRKTNENVRLYDIDLDYQKPLEKNGTLETGAQIKLFNSSNDYQVFTYDKMLSEIKLDNFQSNSVDFSRNILAGYVSLSYTFGQWQAKAGLRGEYTNWLLVQETTNEDYKYEKFDVYPSAYLSRSFQNNQQIQVSYSRRTNRPGVQFLNPFTFFSDGFTAVKGNPDLEPDFTNSFEINYQKHFGATMISLEPYFRQTNNKIARVQELNDEGVLIRTMKNLDKDYSLGIEFMGNIKPSRWLEIIPRATWYKYHLEGNYNADDVVRNSQNWRAGVTTSLKIKQNTSVELTANYESPTVTLEGEQEGVFFSGIALKQYLLNRSGTLSIRVEDIFDSRHMSFTSFSDGFYQNSEMYANAPQVVVSFSYRFNNYQKRMQMDKEMSNQYNIY